MADAGELIAICQSIQLADGGEGVRFDVDDGGEQASAFAIRFRGRVFCYLNRCSHVAMELDWIAGQFFDADGETLLCATHGAIYEPAGGRCIGGPCAGRGGLQSLQVVEQGGVVYWRPDGVVRPPLRATG
jgi:nitrite reductase/ring-hydroxylating ferredoxin subunit